MTSFVDFHCHLDLYPDYPEVVAACERDRVHTLAVTTTPRAWPQNRDLAAPMRHVHPALGLHPQLVEAHEHEISLWESYLHEARFIGEVGLDASPRFHRSIDRQKRVFERILRCCADVGGKVLSVHGVRAFGAVLDQIEASLPEDRGRAVLHWFTGTTSQAKRAIALGCYFSVNREMLKSDRGRSLVRSLPESRILTETDGPFTKIDGYPSRPSDVSVVVHELARFLHRSPDAVAASIHKNLQVLAGPLDP